MYLTYDDYRIYGGTLDETTFTEYDFEAEAQVDWYTFNRLKKEEHIDEAVKRCIYKLIQLIQSVSEFQNGSSATGSNNTSIAGIERQSNDGVSISYNVLTASECVDLAKKDIKRLINIYLDGVKNSLGQRVLYRGIYPNE